MGYLTALIRTRPIGIAACICFLALPLVHLSAQHAAQEKKQAVTLQSAEWERSFEQLYTEALADKPLKPSPLAFRIALAAGGQLWASYDPAEAVGLAVELAMDAEKSLRFGVSAQETRAVLGQREAIKKSNKNEPATLKELAKGRKWDSERKVRMSGKAGNPAGPVGNNEKNNQTDSLPQDGQNNQTDNQGGQGPGQNGAPHVIQPDADPPS